MDILKWVMYIYKQSLHIHDRMMLHHKSNRNSHNSHWNGNAITLVKFSSLAAAKVVKMTIFNAFSNENFIIITFAFSVSYQIMHLHNSIIVLYNAIIAKNDNLYDSIIYAGP